MDKNKEINEFAKQRYEQLTPHQKFSAFEHDLNFLLYDLKDEVTMQDYIYLNEIKQAIIIFILKNEYKESNETFVNNTKHQYIQYFKGLKDRHPDIKTYNIDMFMQKYL